MANSKDWKAGHTPPVRAVIRTAQGVAQLYVTITKLYSHGAVRFAVDCLEKRSSDCKEASEKADIGSSDLMDKIKISRKRKTLLM